MISWLLLTALGLEQSAWLVGPQLVAYWHAAGAAQQTIVVRNAKGCIGGTISLTACLWGRYEAVIYASLKFVPSLKLGKAA